MKNLYTLALVFLCAFVGKAQIINFPDAAFKSKLLSADVTNTIASTETPLYCGSIYTCTVSSYNKIDTNNDGEIQVSEALAIKYLDVCGTYSLYGTIANMTGIESFVNIITLKCNYNVISSLNVSGLTNLQSLGCNNNQLPSLNVSGLTNLQQLICSYNQLPSLNVSGLTQLVNLQCSDNQLPSLNVSGLTNLQILACNNNQIPNLDVSGLTNFNYLDCSNNQLPSLNLSGLTNLGTLYCNINQISNLDVSDSAYLNTLFCDNNLLITLLMKNGSNGTYLGFSGNPNLQYICADEGQIPDVQSKITLYGYTNCHVNSYCSFKPGGIFYTIQGSNRFDANNNGCDVNDNILPSLKLSFTDGTVTGGLIPDISGSYQFDVQEGTHTFTPVFENPSYFNVSPASSSVTFPDVASPFVQDFCVTANGVHPDLEVVLIPITRARPGFDAFYKLCYKNKGNTTQSGTIELTFNDAVLDLVSANPMVSTQTFNSLNWNFSNLVPLATGEIVFTLNVNSPMETPAVIGGDLLSFMANINPISGDETPSDNSFSFNQTVVNSFDPNEKECLEGNNIAPEKVGDYVHYIIRFENDGSANAENIVVKDMIDSTKFDIATLIPESGSATYTTRITNTNQVEFIFQNINLPFAAGTNTGYVAFKIKTKPTLVLGNTFSNTASIYFDYNFPIITNTATTTVQVLSTQDFEFGNYFTIYPNPAKNVLNINTKPNIEVHSITIYNLLGQLVLAIPNAQNVNIVDVSGLKTGNYFLKITSDKGNSGTKIIKE